MTRSVDAGTRERVEREVTLVALGPLRHARCWCSRPPAATPRRSSASTWSTRSAAARRRPDQDLLVRQRRRPGAARRRRRRRATRCGCRTSSSSTSATRWCRRSARDCKSTDIEIVAAGASIGAFHAAGRAVPVPRRVPRRASCMSGTYDLRRLLRRGRLDDDFCGRRRRCTSCPASTGRHLDVLRTRFVLLAIGRGRAEDIGESWTAGQRARRQGIPNRVDSWGPEWPHDWLTWRAMLPQLPRRHG